MDTPSRKLAEKILERLVHEKVLTEQEGNKILPKLAEGTLRSEDWRLAVELNEGKKAKP